ncbi:MAG: hypothetical protein FJ095_20405 [Deltaproteobacteria bacterium]|nr:hypothetical protein [Deltaproteobacteria bacterium]
MNLRNVHQILIVAAASLAALFALRSFVMFARGDGALTLGLALASAAFGVAMTVYLRRFRAKLKAADAVKKLATPASPVE